MKIAGIIPLSPIVPNMREAFKWQWQSYNGFTYAVKDYLELGLMEHLDDPVFIEGLKTIDPAYFTDELARVPVLSIQATDDEFMMFDWSQIWYDSFQKGEVHLLIAPNAEHSLLTNFREVFSSMGTFIRSISEGRGRETRPKFSYTYDKKTG